MPANTMSLLLLLLLTPTEIAGAIVDFSPNWATIFTSEYVTMTCDAYSSVRGDPGYSWYKDGSLISSGQQKYTIVTAQEGHSGEYQCKTRVSYLSEAVKLTVSNSYLALKVPPFVFEGDMLELSCAAYPGYDAGDAELYKGDEHILSSSSGNFNIRRVTMETSGSYTCSRSVKHHLIYYGQKSSVYISVKELFSKPIISVNPGPQINEGDHMTITCDTELSPHRETTKLQFAFYRNGHNVQGFSSSKQYGVPSARLGDFGKYTCEIRTQSESVKKESDPKSIQIKAQKLSDVSVRLEPAGGQVIAGERLEIICSVQKGMGLLHYSWCKQSSHSCDTKESSALEQRFVVERVSEDYGGEYQCTVTRVAIGNPIPSRNIFISVRVKLGKPELKLSPGKVAVGDSVDLLCESKIGSFPVDYEFYHRNDSIGKGKAEKKEDAKYQVTVTSITMTGPYSCALQNDVSSKMQLSEGLNLSVMEPVADARITPGEDVLAVTVEDNLCLTCSVEKGTSPSFLWLYNETFKNGSGLFQVQESGRLLCIESVQLHHAGTYRCQASNQLSPNRIFSVTSNNVTISISGKSYLMMGIGITVALVALLFVTTIVAIKCRSNNCCHSPKSSGGLVIKDLNRSGLKQQAPDHYTTNNVTPSAEQSVYANLGIEDVTHGKEDCYGYYINHDPTASSFPKNNIDYNASVSYTAEKNKSTIAFHHHEETDSSIYENFSAS